MIACISLALLSCNNSSKPKDDANYYIGKDLYENKCSSCHSFLTIESLNKTSLDQMRQLSFETLYIRINTLKSDSNHIKPPLNVNNLSDDDIKKIVYYIKKTGEPKP